jgi:hypothetical protein
MIHLLKIGSPAPIVFDAGFLEIDFDPDAERYMVLDRRNAGIIWLGPVPQTNPAKLIVPIEYTTSNNLLVMLFDDAGDPRYNMVGNDMVQAQLVDARTVTTNP